MRWRAATVAGGVKGWLSHCQITGIHEIPPLTPLAAPKITAEKSKKKKKRWAARARVLCFFYFIAFTEF